MNKSLTQHCAEDWIRMDKRLSVGSQQVASTPASIPQMSPMLLVKYIPEARGHQIPLTCFNSFLPTALGKRIQNAHSSEASKDGI